MRKRIAYLGLSYPLGYDYHNDDELIEYDLDKTPNPIIESPLGLMILYDELWFLCEGVCPINMRKLPYVKFVDKMFDDLYFEGFDLFGDDMNLSIDFDSQISFKDIRDRMQLSDKFSLDNHSRGMKIGNIIRSGNADDYNLLFDIYVLTSLQERNTDSIELVSNSIFRMNDAVISNKDAEIAEKLIIPNIPNYLSKEGPYHPCMDELRESKYLIDFRKWIIENHNNIQTNEINEICTDVEKIINNTKDKVFNKYLEDNSKFAFYSSTGTTILKTGAGIIYAPISVLEAIAQVRLAGKRALEIQADRWQGFVINSRSVLNSKVFAKN